MKSYRVRMTEGVEMRLRLVDGHHKDLNEEIERAIEFNLLVRVQEAGPGNGTLAINPRHVLYVREVAE